MNRKAHRTRFGAVFLGVACFGLVACSSGTPASPTAAPAKPAASAAPATTAAAPQPSAAAAPKPSLVPSPSVAAAPAAPAYDEKAIADFYRGKTIHLTVGYAAGGGYDTYARLISKYYGKYIPGNPNVIVENVPGGGSAVALSQVYNTLPKDGTYIGIGSGGLALNQLETPGQFDYDYAKFQYIGAPSVFEYILFISKAASERTGVKKFDDILGPNGKQIVLGTTGSGLDFITQQLMRQALGANVKTVSGYAGSSNIRLAMDTGELDGYNNGWDSIQATNLDDVLNGNYLLLATLTDHQIQGVPSSVPPMPLWTDYAKTDEQKQALKYGADDPETFSRAYMAAPGVPADRIAALRDAFMKTAADPDLKADAAKAQLELKPVPGEELQQTVLQYMSMPDSVKQALKPLVTP